MGQNRTTHMASMRSRRQAIIQANGDHDKLQVWVEF